MDAKLTLNIDKEIAHRAKLYARSQGRSLSDLVESFLKSIIKGNPSGESNIPPLTKRLLGSIDLPTDFDYKKELSQTLIEKHLGNA